MIRSNYRAHAVSLFMVRNRIHRATGNRVALQTSRLLPTRYVVADRAITTAAQSPSAEIAAAFDSLQHSLRAYLRRQVKDLSIAEDLLQDIFVKALAASDADRSPKNLQGWLYAAARTTVIDFYRSSRPATGEVDKLASDSQDIDDELLHRELATCLRPLVGQLPAIYRDTLLATDFDGETMQAVAIAQGLSVSPHRKGLELLFVFLLVAFEIEHGGVSWPMGRAWKGEVGRGRIAPPPDRPE